MKPALRFSCIQQHNEVAQEIRRGRLIMCWQEFGAAWRVRREGGTSEEGFIKQSFEVHAKSEPKAQHPENNGV